MKTINYPPEKIRLFKNLPRREPFLQDSTAMKLLMDCRRKYFYRIVLGRVPVEGQSNQVILDFGTAYHKFREILELHGYLKAMTYILEFPLSPADPKSKWGYLDKNRLVKSCHKAYEHWQNEKKLGKIKVIAVEQPFNVELADGLFISGRADQIVEMNGRLWGRDFKTTTKDEGTFTKDLDPNDQAIRYIWGEGKIHSQPLQGILFEAIYNAKTVGPVIYTKPSTRNEYQIKVWEEEQKLNNELLEIYRDRDIWPMDTGRKCVWCEFHKVCRIGNPQSQENILKTNFKFQPWDSEKVDQQVAEVE